jgi:Fic-DOC domain mobile mystery protein B
LTKATSGVSRHLDLDVADDHGAAEGLPRFNARTIGPEPSGATPIEDEDLDGLIPDFVATRADLNQVEFENISGAIPWARNQAASKGPNGVLEYSFMVALHKRMFGDVWKWAGSLRRRVTNIGIDPALIVTQSRLLFDDALFWNQHHTFSTDEIAARIHCRLVSIHPFPNGNGRCTRLVADLYLVSVGAEPFIWGGIQINEETPIRAQYLAALLEALETDDYRNLVAFARGIGETSPPHA